MDIPFPTPVRRRLVEDMRAQPHHVLPDSGWVSFYLQQADDVERAIALLRESFDLAARQQVRRQTTKG